MDGDLDLEHIPGGSPLEACLILVGCCCCSGLWLVAAVGLVAAVVGGRSWSMAAVSHCARLCLLLPAVLSPSLTLAALLLQGKMREQGFELAAKGKNDVLMKVGGVWGCLQWG